MEESDRTRRLWLALAAATLVAVVVGPATGLARYLGGRDAVAAHVQGVVAQADALSRAAVGDLSTLVAGAGEVAALAVVRSGGTDDFGIARGAEVALEHLVDEAARPADEAAGRQALLDRAAELESLDGASGALPLEQRWHALKRGEVELVVIDTPIVDANGAWAGMTRLTSRIPEPEDPVPTWRLLLVLLGVGLLAAWLLPAAGRWLGLSAAALGLVAATLVVSGQTPTFIAWTAGLAALVTAGGVRPLAAILRGLREQPATYLYVVPAMVGMVALVFVPFGMGLVLAFFDSQGEPVGLANFSEILFPTATGDTNFYWTLGVTVVWTLSNVVLHLAIGLSLALVLNRPSLRFRAAYRVLLIIPWAVPNYITALIWKWMFHTQYGAINALLAIFGIGAVDWLGQSVATNFIANLVTNVWLGFPFMMVVSLGALQSIPKDLYEAATIDGANRWQAFRHITLPLLKPALVPAIILGSIWTFNMFNVIYLVSGGGPDGKTDILITEAYHAFKVLKRYGFAAAYSLLIFVILYAYGAMTNRVSKAAEGAYG